MNKNRKWRIIYAVCCLVYLGWMINLSAIEFDKINSQYSRVIDQLEGGRIKAAAREELVDECRRESTTRVDLDEDNCSSLTAPVLAAREKKIEERRLQAKKRAVIKLALFYMGFLVIFLLAPPIFVYLFIVGIAKVFSRNNASIL